MLPAIDAEPAPARRDYALFTVLLGLYLVVLYPILRANRYYNDDLKRALIGRTGWDSNGRPLTTLLMKLLQCYDRALVDISPLTQIAGIAVLAWIGVLVARRYTLKSPLTAALIAFPLGAQPFFLENLSYKFDSLSMCLAMLFALLPILMARQDRRGWWLGVLSIFVCLNLYQPAINTLLVFVLLDISLAQLEQRDPRSLLRELGARLLQIGLGMLVYQLVVGIHVNGWVKQKSAKIHDLQELALLKTNFVHFFSYIGANFNQQWTIYAGLALFALALAPITIALRYAWRLRRAGPIWMAILALIGALLLPLVALACVPGAMLALLDPPLIPRVLMAIGALLTSGLIILHLALQPWRAGTSAAHWLAAAMALAMCSLASAYGNALGEQREYEARIGAQLGDDIEALRAHQPIDNMLIDGTPGYAPITAHVAEEFPLIHALIPTYIDADDTFHTQIFLAYYVAEIGDLRLRADADGGKLMPVTDAASNAHIADLIASTCTLPALHETRSYSLYLTQDIAVVIFRARHQRACAGDAIAPAKATAIDSKRRDDSQN